MTGAELSQLAAELGIDVVGAAPAAPYDDTERAHPRAARSRASSPTCGSRWRDPRSRAIPSCCSTVRERSSPRRSATAADVPEPSADEGRLPRYTWRDEYATLRERLDALGRRLGGDVPRARRRQRPRRPRGSGPRRDRLLRQEHDGHHAPARLVGRPRRRSSRTSRSSRRRRSSSTAASADSASTHVRRALSTSRARSTRRSASRTGRRRPRRSPTTYRAELGDMVYGCDICQEVCPWNRGVEKRRRGERSRPTPPRVSRSRTGSSDDGDELVAEFDRLYVPRNDARWLRRNALVAAGNVGTRGARAERRAVRRRSDDPILRDDGELGARRGWRSAGA